MGNAEKLQSEIDQSHFQTPERRVADIGRKLLYNEDFYADEVKKRLTKPEIEMLDELTNVSRRIADVYTIQKSINFYPEKLSNEELTKEAGKKPELLSPYTYIRRNSEGELIAIPTHEIFAAQIKEKGIIESLKKAADIAYRPDMRDSQMYAYLRSRANAFKFGNWQESEILWLTMTELPKVFIVLGPYDTYLDKQRGLKFAFQSWVGVLNEDATEKAQDFTGQFLAQHENKTGVKSPDVKVRVDDTIIKSGQAAEYKWSGNSLPCQPDLRKKFGSVFTIFKPTFDDKLAEKRIPVYRSVIHPLKRQGVTDEQVASAYQKNYLGHEITHSFVPSDAQERLGNDTQWVKELDCDLTSLDINFDLAKSKREQEIIFASFFANGFVEYLDYINDPERFEYYLGSSIALNYCLTNESMQIENDSLCWENTDQVVGRLRELQKIVRSILESGTKKEARSLSMVYYDDEFYKKLKNEPKLPSFLRSAN